MARIFNLLPWRRRRLERDLDRELRYHLDRRIEDLKRAGVSEFEARKRATLELGGIAQVQEEVRDTWMWGGLDVLGRDLRFAGRTLRRNPGFAAAAVLSLALGIGANAAIFSLVDQVLLRPLPVHHAERLVLMDWRGQSLSAQWGSWALLSYPLCRDLESQNRFFDGVFCRHPTGVNVSTGQQHELVQAEIISGSYFPVLGVRPELGRFIDPSDDRDRMAHPVVVLSHDFWTTHLGGARDVAGRTVLVNNYPMTVVGVAPAGFRGVDPTSAPALWLPAMMKHIATPEWDYLLNRRAFWMHTFARLKPGVTAQAAQAGLTPWFVSILEAETRLEGFPVVTAEQRRAFLASTLSVEPASRGISEQRAGLKRPLWVLMAGTTLLLLLACLNVAGLLLARGAARSRELTTRVALGASRGRITGQVLVESGLITAAGVVLGLGAAPAVFRALLFFLSDSSQLRFGIDHRLFFFALGAGVLTTVLCGLAPAIQTARIPLIATLKEKSELGTARGVRLRKALLTGQMAFTLILLIGAGLFVQTVAGLRAKGPGFDTGSLLMFRVDPPSIGYPEADADRAMRTLLGNLQNVPGVEAVAVANTHMLNNSGSSSVFTVQHDERIVTDRVTYMRVGPGFFSVLGTELVAGRDFSESDIRAPGTPEIAPRVVIVNESFARKYFGTRNPVGHRLGLGNRPTTVTDIEIIGVVKDFSRRNLRDQGLEQLYFCFWDRQSADGSFYLRMRGSPEAGFAAIRETVAKVDRTLPVTGLTTFESQMDRSLNAERMLSTLSSAFGMVALLLSVVGLYGVMSFVVTRRTQEIGVRLALGATRSDAVWLVIREALVMLGAGTAVALVSAKVLGRMVEAQLYGIDAFDAPTFVMASGLLVLVSLGAALIPAWRAASVSPTEALRYD